MATTTHNSIAHHFLKRWTREMSLIAMGTTLVGIATILLFASTNYFDATRQGLNASFSRSVLMYSLGFLPWFLLGPFVVITSQRRLFGRAPLWQRARDGALLMGLVFTLLFVNMLFVYAPAVGIPSNEIAGMVGFQAWIPDLLMFVIAVLCGRALQRSVKEEYSEDAETHKPIDIVVKSVSRMDIVSSDDVMAVSAQGNYVSLVTQDRELLHRATLSHMSTQLDNHGFIQIHRSHLVKSQEIASVHRKDGRVRELMLRNGTKLPVSPSGARKLPTIFANSET